MNPADPANSLRAAARRLLTAASASPPRRPAPGGPPPWRGLYLGGGRRGPVFGGAEHHALILGPPRSGKTTRLAVPNLRLHPGPAVVTSTKPDILTATLPWRQQRGTCWAWDPTGTLPRPDDLAELRWSPVIGCHHWDAAVARAHALSGAARPATARYGNDHHWIERAEALLAPLLHAAALSNGDLAAVGAWLHRRSLLEPCTTLRHHHSTIAADLLEGVALTDPRELSGIVSTADGLLAAYRTTTALATTTHPNFDPDTFATSTDTVYLVAPGTAQDLVAPLIVCLLDQIRTATYQRHPHPPMLWVLDELAHIAPLADLPATIAEGASQGLLVAALLQDLSQARARWGTAADGFATLFTHKLLLPGIADLPTLQHISTLTGQHDLPVTSRTRPAPLTRGNPSTTTSPQQRPRLPIDTIANGHPHTALWLNHTQPQWVHLPTWPGPPATASADAARRAHPERSGAGGTLGLPRSSRRADTAAVTTTTPGEEHH